MNLKSRIDLLVQQEPGILKNKVVFEQKLFTYEELMAEKLLLDEEVDLLRTEISEQRVLLRGLDTDCFDSSVTGLRKIKEEL